MRCRPPFRAALARLGQADGAGFLKSLWNAAANAAENVAGGLPVNAPAAGGGWVSLPNPVDPTTQLVKGVDDSGNETVYSVPATWTPAQITDNLASTGAGQTTTDSLKQAAADADPIGLGGWGLAIGGVAALGLFAALRGRHG